MFEAQTKVFVDTEMPQSLQAILRRHLRQIRSHHFQVRDNTEMGMLVLTGEPGQNEGQYSITLTRNLKGNHETLLSAVYQDGELASVSSGDDDVWSEDLLEEFIAAIAAGGEFTAAPAWEQVHRLTEFRRVAPVEELATGEVEVVE